MPTRVQQRQRRRKARSDAAQSTEPAREQTVGEEVKHDLDDLLGEIDGVLEENAEEFVKGFVQKGGQ